MMIRKPEVIVSENKDRGSCTVSVANGNGNICHLLFLKNNPNEDYGTKTFIEIIGYMAKENKRLKKQVRKLERATFSE